jgi:AraC-like DNA-binding protein
MPQQIDPLPRRLDEALRLGLRDFFTHYEVEIISCAFWRNRPPWSLERRRCPDTFLLFPVRGVVRAVLDRTTVRIGPGDYLALADGRAHALRLEEGHPRLEQISLHCRIQDRWGRPLLARFRRPMAALADAARWHRDLTDLASLMASDPATGRRFGRVLVSELVADRLRSGEMLLQIKRGGDPRVERVLARMDEELGSPGLSVEALAREVGITATQMRKLFRRETQIGPKQYLQRLRLRRAARLLRHSARTVKEIAFECGFATDNYFHLAFRQAFDATPAGYRDREML